MTAETEDAVVESRRGVLLAAARTPEERAFLEARLAGAPFAVRAAALGVAHLPRADQQMAMKRAWDRLLKRVPGKARRRRR